MFFIHLLIIFKRLHDKGLEHPHKKLCLKCEWYFYQGGLLIEAFSLKNDIKIKNKGEENIFPLPYLLTNIKLYT